MTAGSRAGSGGSAGSALRPAAAVVGGIVSMCVGTSFAKRLFPALGAEGTTALRVGFSALLLVSAWRPWRRRLDRRQSAPWRSTASRSAP